MAERPVVNRKVAGSIPAGGAWQACGAAAWPRRFVDLAQLVEHGFEAPAALVRLQESTLNGMALVAQSAERHVANVEAAGSSPARRIWNVAVITQPAECQSSKLERWVRIPLTA